MRNSRMEKRIPKVVGGRVPMDDLRNWIDEFKLGSNPLSQEEIQLFFEYHLADNVAKLVTEGFSENQCFEKIISEISKNGNKPNKNGIEFVKYIISLAYRKKY